MKLRRPLYGPGDPRGPSRGRDVVAVKRGLNKVERDFFPRPAGGFDPAYNRKTVDAVKAFQRIEGIEPTGHLGQATLDALWPYMDAYARLMYRTYSPPRPPAKIPDLGPITPGDASLLDFDLTHPTGGLAGYPALDSPFGAGKPIIAPEPLVVWKASSARRRDGDPNGKAFYARGDTFDYWIGHTTDVPAISALARATRGRLGPKIPKGARLTTVSANHEAPHGHVGVNSDRLLGRELEHRTDYQHGAPTIREQLERALA